MIFFCLRAASKLNIVHNLYKKLVQEITVAYIVPIQAIEVHTLVALLNCVHYVGQNVQKSAEPMTIDKLFAYMKNEFKKSSEENKKWYSEVKSIKVTNTELEKSTIHLLTPMLIYS